MPRTAEANGTRSRRASDDWKKYAWEAAKGIVTVASAAFAFLANENAKTATMESERAKLAVTERSQQAEFDLKAYDLVEKTLALDPASRQARGLATAAMVNALTKPPLLDQLQNVLRVGTNDPVLNQHIRDAMQFDQDSHAFDSTGRGDSVIKLVSRSSAHPSRERWSLVSAAYAQGTTNDLKGYRVDLFYCESPASTTTESRKRRADVANDKLAKSGTGVGVRVRLLPALVQARPGYQSVADEIRYSDDVKERPAATQLGKLLGINPANLRRVATTTPKYISVFYCAA